VGKKWEVDLIGTGGQGMVTVSIILAEAAVHEGRNVVQSQNYGPEVRGGHSTSYVIMSDNSSCPTTVSSIPRSIPPT